ncbi:hypothetical protein LA080_002916 [Diaporthe eres]|nr:hypothetical protein LA080_002916 [Diaporthe eres]
MYWETEKECRAKITAAHNTLSARSRLGPLRTWLLSAQAGSDPPAPTEMAHLHPRPSPVVVHPISIEPSLSSRPVRATTLQHLRASGYQQPHKTGNLQFPHVTINAGSTACRLRIVAAGAGQYRAADIQISTERGLAP